MSFNIDDARKLYNSRFKDYESTFNSLYDELENYLRSKVATLGVLRVIVDYMDYIRFVDLSQDSLGVSDLPLKTKDFYLEFLSRAVDTLEDNGFYADIDTNDSESKLSLTYPTLEIYGWNWKPIGCFGKPLNSENKETGHTEEDEEVGILDDYSEDAEVHIDPDSNLEIIIGTEDEEDCSEADDLNEDNFNNDEDDFEDEEDDFADTFNKNVGGLDAVLEEVEELVKSGENVFDTDRKSELDWFDEKEPSLSIDETGDFSEEDELSFD